MNALKRRKFRKLSFAYQHPISAKVILLVKETKPRFLYRRKRDPPLFSSIDALRLPRRGGRRRDARRRLTTARWRRRSVGFLPGLFAIVRGGCRAPGEFFLRSSEGIIVRGRKRDGVRRRRDAGDARCTGDDRGGPEDLRDTLYFLAPEGQSMTTHSARASHLRPIYRCTHTLYAKARSAVLRSRSSHRCKVVDVREASNYETQ